MCKLLTFGAQLGEYMHLGLLRILPRRSQRNHDAALDFGDKNRLGRATYADSWLNSSTCSRAFYQLGEMPHLH